MRKRAVAVAVSLLSVASGCADGAPTGETAAQDEQSDSGETSASTGESTAESTADVSTNDESTADESTNDESTNDVSTSDDPAMEAAPVDDGPGGETFAGDSDSDWCVAAREVEALSDELDSDMLNFADPAAVEAAYTGFVEAIDAARAVAPPEIAADVETTFTGFSLLSETLAAVEWNFLDADLSVIDELDAEMSSAGDRIGDYNEQVCGISADDDDEPAGADEDATDFDPSAGTPREQMAAALVTVGFTPEEADCIVQQIDIAAYLETNDEQLFLDAAVACGIPRSRLGG